MRKSLFAIAVLATLGAASLAAPASAAPGMIGAVESSAEVVQVRRDGHHGMRGHGHHRGHHMGRGHHRGHHMMRHGHHHRHMHRHRGY